MWKNLSLSSAVCASTALLVLFRFFSLVKKCFLTRNSSNGRRQERTEIPHSHGPEEPCEFDWIWLSFVLDHMHLVKACRLESFRFSCPNYFDIDWVGCASRALWIKWRSDRVQELELRCRLEDEKKHQKDTDDVKMTWTSWKFALKMFEQR